MLHLRSKYGDCISRTGTNNIFPVHHTYHHSLAYRPFAETKFPMISQRIFRTLRKLCLLVMHGVCLAPARAQSPPGESSQQAWFTVAPNATDPQIIHNDAQNLIHPTASPTAPLLVFLGGAPSLAADPAGLFLAEAARLGFRVVALDYRYNPPGTALCQSTGQDPCFSAYRAQKVFGIGNTPGIAVDPAESIQHRLTALLATLAGAAPDAGWQTYLARGTPVWSRITLSGFSQGSGLAAYLAKHVTVARVALLSSPWDHYDTPPRLAAWLSAPGATPPQRWFGLYASGEPAAVWLAQAYAALGLPPAHIHILTAPPRREPTNPMAYHWSVIGRGFTPRAPDGTPAYLPDWDFVLTGQN
jgi:hypothetical protein